MKRKIAIVAIILYVIIAALSTIFLLNHNAHGAYETKEYYYVCDKNVKKYDKNSLIRFAKNVDILEYINEEIYYYDNDDKINYDKLNSYDQDKKVFKVSDEEYKIDQFLGKPDKEYKILGYLLNFVTTKSFYLAFVIIPFTVIFIYEMYQIIVKNRKESSNERQKEKED